LVSDVLIPLSTLLVGAVLGAVVGWVGSTLVWRRQELRDLRSEIVQDIMPTIRETAHTSRVSAVRRLSRMEPMLPPSDRRLTDRVEHDALELERARDHGGDVQAATAALEESLAALEKHINRRLEQWWR
jgi:hypothetical protein